MGRPAFVSIVLTVVLPTLGASAAVGLLLLTIMRLFRIRPALSEAALLFACATLGAVIGVMLGASRSPAVNAVLPGLLTLLTSLGGLAFARETGKALRPIIPFLVVAVLLASLYGAFHGAGIRADNEDFEIKNKRWMLHYEKVELELEKSRCLKELDRALKAGINVPCRIP